MKRKKKKKEVGSGGDDIVLPSNQVDPALDLFVLPEEQTTKKTYKVKQPPG